MARTVKTRIFAGSTCEQLVYNVPDGTRYPGKVDPEKQKKERFETTVEYDAFKEAISRRTHARNFNANFSPSSLYGTLTFDVQHELHDFIEARRIRKNFVAALKRVYPEAVIFLYMGRGSTSTHRIHFHMVSEGIPKEFIEKKWKYGSVKRIDNLRECCFYEGVNHGQDYTGLANYLFDHWTPEQGGHRWFQTKNAKKPEREEPTEVKLVGGYSEKRPPRAPKGYILVETKSTKYGFMYFKYVRKPAPRPRAKKRNNPGESRVDGLVDV